MAETCRTQFDSQPFWSRRLEEQPALTGTGTAPFGPLYQRWLYKLKEVAIKKLLRPYRDRLQSAEVLNVGCGTGYFEPFFARYGAGHVTGVDFVKSAIETLRRKHTPYEYLTADISEPLPEDLIGRTFNLVTAIDVLYHIVDESSYRAALGNLCRLCHPQGGLLLWTDAPGRENNPAQSHCRYRSWSDYDRILSPFHVHRVAWTPMYYLFDVYNRRSEFWARYPRWSYPLMYVVDRLLAARGWRKSTNYCFLAVRQVPDEEVPG